MRTLTALTAFSCYFLCLNSATIAQPNSSTELCKSASTMVRWTLGTQPSVSDEIGASMQPSVGQDNNGRESQYTIILSPPCDGDASLEVHFSGHASGIGTAPNPQCASNSYANNPIACPPKINGDPRKDNGASIRVTVNDKEQFHDNDGNITPPRTCCMEGH